MNGLVSLAITELLRYPAFGLMHGAFHGVGARVWIHPNRSVATRAGQKPGVLSAKIQSIPYILNCAYVTAWKFRDQFNL